MVWLLSEILVFVAAAVVFGGLIGLGLAGSTSRRRAVAFQREHHGLIDRVQTYERSQRTIEAKAMARGAAEAAARGDLEARLVEMETAAAEYRARAEASERRVHTMQSAAGAPEVIEVVAPLPAAAANGADESERMLRGQEIESLRAQLALAEQVRARTEIDLAIAKARAQDAAPAQAEPDAPAAPRNANAGEGERPPGLAAPRGGRADDLRRIRGIGLKNEGVLNALGIYHYGQIAALTPANVAWLDAYLKFHGRIARDDWVGQAKALMGLESAAADKVHPRDAGA